MDDNQESQIHGDDLEKDDVGTARVLKEEEEEEVEKNDNKVSAEKNGRLCFKLLKLKHPNTESFLQQHPAPKEELLVSSPSPTTRICNICNRGFGSGKALGGHMRMHVQARNKELLEKLNNATTTNTNTTRDIIAKTQESFSITEEGEPTCYVCKKTFLSMKSLFGHMRSHPERDWRGIQPPTTPTDHKHYNNCSSSSTLSDEKLDTFPAITATSEVFVDLSESLSSWRVTGKRGRKSTDSANDSGLPLDIDHADAVFGLMTLAYVDPRQASNMSCNSMMDARKKLRIDEGRSSSREVLPNTIEAKGKGKPPVVEETALEVPLNMKWNLFGYEEESPREYYRHNSNDSSELDSADKTVGETMMMSNKRKTRKVKLVELEALGGDQSHHKQVDSVTPNRYICSLCNRSFPTHQALGGHRSSHNKVMKYIQQQTLDESVSADDSTAENYGHYANPTTTTQMDEEAVLGPTTHQCKICDRTFPTGQALGGHKRCHWNGTVEMQSSQVTSPEGEAKAQSSQATSPGEASQTGRRNLEFDLNELPAMEVEEGIVESIYMAAA
uniref:C2H2-type domain-containing protein n=2 Tax=Quercus lobata TaxID=97700 RepID=A0A7N2M835_QUELO